MEDIDAFHHANIERLGLAEFMAIPYYTYLVLKMSGPNIVIIIQGKLKQTFIYDREECSHVESQVI